MDEQQEKLDTIIDLVKSLENNDNLQQNIEKINQTMTQILEERKKSQNLAIDNKDSNAKVSLKKIFPLLMMGIVCLSGYTSYKYIQKRK